MLITNDPELSQTAENCGVGRIFIDLETIGKKERQGHLDTLISDHTLTDISRLRSVLSEAELLVRLNPLHLGTKLEVDTAIGDGADILMLPMFHTVDEVLKFTELVDGRARVMPLVETYDAAKTIEKIVQVPGIAEIYIGLNDLHLDMRLKFMFEPVANGMLDEIAEIIKDQGLPFGFGGVARIGEGIIPGELVLGEHLRLGSSSVILSRTFHRKDDVTASYDANDILKIEINKLFSAYNKLKLRSDDQIDMDHRQLQSIVSQYLAVN